MNQNIAIFQRTFCTTRENNLLFRPQQQQILKSHHPDATTAQDFQLSVNGKKEISNRSGPIIIRYLILAWIDDDLKIAILDLDQGKSIKKIRAQNQLKIHPSKKDKLILLMMNNQFKALIINFAKNRPLKIGLDEIE